MYTQNNVGGVSRVDLLTGPEELEAGLALARAGPIGAQQSPLLLAGGGG